MPFWAYVYSLPFVWRDRLECCRIWEKMYHGLCVAVRRGQLWSSGMSVLLEL